MRYGCPGVPSKEILFACALVTLPSCSDGRPDGERARHGRGVELCVEAIEAHVKAPQVRSIATSPGRAEARIYFVARHDDGDSSVATCRWQPTPTGGLRLAAVAIDGRELSELELLVRNADLLLEDLRGSPRS